MAAFSRDPREHWLKPYFSKNEVANSGYITSPLTMQYGFIDLCIADDFLVPSGDFDHSCHAEACAYSAADCRTMPRKRDVNLSHCGNAISRMWSPFGWVRNGGLTRRRNAASGHKMFIAAGSDFFGKFTTQDAFLILAT